MAALNAGEMDCLAALWEAHAKGKSALKLSAIHEAICSRRAGNREAEPALTTVSTYLRGLLAKKLVNEVVVGDGDTSVPYDPGHRGVLPTTRSPRTGYQAAQKQDEVLKETFKALAQLYPGDERWKMVVDCARTVLELTEDKVQRLQKLVRQS